MSGTEEKKLSEYIEEIPSPGKIRQRIAENLRERQLLRRLLKLAEDRQRVEEVRSCE